MGVIQAGAIPLLISDNALLPEGFDWESCCIKVALKDVDKIQQIIEKITPVKEIKMRDACLTAYKMFSGENFTSPITRFYKCSTVPDKKFDLLNLDASRITNNSEMACSFFEMFLD